MYPERLAEYLAYRLKSRLNLIKSDYEKSFSLHFYFDVYKEYRWDACSLPGGLYGVIEVTKGPRQGRSDSLFTYGNTLNITPITLTAYEADLIDKEIDLEVHRIIRKVYDDAFKFLLKERTK